MDEGLKVDIVRTIKDDWLSIADIEYLVRHRTGSSEDLLAKAVAAATELVSAGAIVPGELKNGFKPWPDPPEAAVRKIRTAARELAERGEGTPPGAICWFDVP
ncbi:hypothetical protein [Goodfellowiella coeruleoviolacea]|uniref:Uncharacterized protein n=1 Tax=Goodfellowiella coeruleoviolacea TaxID=334858 RepID=A0AAE3KJM1_9PSEU|nr:hypothetical protein [Goodfellowiella coeruleoviolacea]MCP2169237.1 hypothetical protein [Goodfellowiella coeruleoviolacea]